MALMLERNVERVLNEPFAMVAGNHTYGAWNYLPAGKREDIDQI